jgi:hypothetical protein
VKLLIMEFKLTEIDKFIGVTWLLYKAYSEKILRSIVCMHIKSSLPWESRVMRLRIVKGDEIENRQYPMNEWEVDQME